MSKIQWNVTSDQDKIEELRDDELPSDPPGYVPSAPEQERAEEEMEVGQLGPVDLTEDEEEADDATILTNARLRLEQGRLYEMLMTSDIFNNLDADPQAVKNVQREMKRFAKDRMEVMLGMKRPSELAGSVVSSPFNSVEVEVLKSLAKKLSGGATEQVSGPQAPPKSKTLTPISSNSGKTTKIMTKTAVAKAAVAKAIQPKEPVKTAPAVDPTLANKKMEDMTYDEKIEYNRQKSAVYESKKVKNPEAIPMPSVESANAFYGSKGITMNQIEKNFKR